MRAVIQRVQYAKVLINKHTERSIEQGLLILAGVEEEDREEDVAWLAGKISRLRVFDDGEGRMNLGVMDIDGELMVISQFTLHASTKKGNRPSWIRAAEPVKAEKLYQMLGKLLEELTGKKVVWGEFGAHMDISLVNDGPVTIIIDSKLKE